MKLAITDLSNFDIDDQMLILCLSCFIATVKTTSTTLKQATNFEREKKKSGLAAGSHMQDSNYQTLPTMNFKTNFSSSLRFTYICVYNLVAKICPMYPFNSVEFGKNIKPRALSSEE